MDETQATLEMIYHYFDCNDLEEAENIYYGGYREGLPWTMEEGSLDYYNIEVPEEANVSVSFKDGYARGHEVGAVVDGKTLLGSVPLPAEWCEGDDVIYLGFSVMEIWLN